MKKLFLLIVIFLLSLTFVGSYAQNNCTTPPCYGQGGDSCNCTEWSDWAFKQISMEVPGYPDCWIFANVCYRQCTNPTANCVEMYIDDWFIDYLKCGNNCNNLISYLTTGTDLERARKGNRFRIFLIRTISRMWFEEFIQIPGVEIPCNGSERLKITHFLTSCGTTCYTQYPIDDPEQPLYTEYKSCSDTYCCTVTEIFCQNQDGSINQTEEVTRDTNIDCSTLNFPLTNCKPGQNVYVYPCIDPCEDF